MLADEVAFLRHRRPLREGVESHWIEKRSHGGDEVHDDFNRAVFENRDRLLDPSD